MNKDLILDAARRLHDAERSRRQIRQLTLEYPDISLQDAYAIQKQWIDLKLQEGRKVRGHKIGLTSKAMQYASNIDEPDYGVLLDDSVYEDGCNLSTDRFIVPRLEVELAFLLGKPLSGPGCTVVDVLGATDYVVPAVEVIDARIHRVDPQTKATRKVFDTIADNAAFAAVIVGGRPIRPDDMDLRWVSALCYRNGIIEESGVAAAVLNHPANGVAWLANKLGRFNVTLQAGHMVLGGSFTRPVDVRSRDTFHVDYGPLGTITCHFS